MVFQNRNCYPSDCSSSPVVRVRLSSSSQNPKLGPPLNELGWLTPATKAIDLDCSETIKGMSCHCITSTYEPVRESIEPNRLYKLDPTALTTALELRIRSWTGFV